jgi:arylformamidase
MGAMPSWQEFDRARLDTEYSPSLTAKDFHGAVAGYATASAAAKRLYCRRALLDQRYGDSPRALLDVFPARGTPAPIHIFIHGGFWQELSKDYAAFPAPAFIAAGSAFVAVNYTLAPQATLAGIVAEIRAAFAWVRHNAPRFGGDPDNIVVSGHSAGAYLAAALIATEGATVVPGLRGLCLISGVYQLEPIRRSYVNDKLALRPSDISALDILATRPVADVPVHVFVGADETPEFRRQSAALHAAWAPHLTDCRHVALPGRDHFDILSDLSSPQGAIHRDAVALAGAAR